MKLNLPPEVYTPQQVSATLAELRHALKQQEHEAVKAKVKGKPVVVDHSLPGQIEALERALAKAPRLQVTLAAMPTEGLKRQLVDWLRANISPNILVEFSYNSALLGGMVVRVGSRIFDWSFRRQILAAAPTFTQRLRNV